MVWETPPSSFQSWVRATRKLLLVTVMGGFIAGAGIALGALSDFSYLPGVMGFFTTLLAGTLIGMLIPSFGQALTAVLLSTVVSVGVSTLALFYPELQVSRLGVEVAFELSIAQGLISNLLAIPFAITGLLIGKILIRSD